MFACKAIIIMSHEPIGSYITSDLIIIQQYVQSNKHE